MSDEQTDIRDDDEDVEAHGFVSEEPGEDDAEKMKMRMKMKTKTATDEPGDEVSETARRSDTLEALRLVARSAGPSHLRTDIAEATAQAAAGRSPAAALPTALWFLAAAEPRLRGERHGESSVTAISWIPSEAISGCRSSRSSSASATTTSRRPTASRRATSSGCATDRFREANHLKAWIEVEDKAIVGYGHEGGGLVGSTATFRLGFRSSSGVAFDVLQAEPEVRSNSVRFVQTVGGRAGFPRRAA